MPLCEIIVSDDGKWNSRAGNAHVVKIELYGSTTDELKLGAG